jgi:hypothetical protein
MEQTTIPDTPMPAETTDASPSVKGGKARMKEMTPAKRRALGRKAAKARWAKNKTETTTEPCTTRKIGKRRASNEVFGIALTAAEKRLAKAIEERARAASTWAVLNAEIPSLQRTIAALRNQQNPNVAMQDYAMQMPDGSMTGYQSNVGPVGYNLASVVSDAVIPFAQTPQPAAQPQAAVLRPLAASRVGGGAVGVNLADDDDEDKFLNESGVAGGQWH